MNKTATINILVRLKEGRFFVPATCKSTHTHSVFKAGEAIAKRLGLDAGEHGDRLKGEWTLWKSWRQSGSG